MYQPLFARMLTEDERGELASVAAARTGEEFRRAEVVLLSAAGRTPSDIAERLGYHPSNVKKWIKKFNEEGLPGIAVRKRGPREGPKPRFTQEQIEAILRIAKTDPSGLGLGFERWTAQKLAKAAVERGIVQSISHVTVRQMLKRDERPFTNIGQPAAQTEDRIGAGRTALANSEFEKAADILYAALTEGGHSDEAEAEIRVVLSEALEELSRFEEVYSTVAKYEDPHAVVALSPGMRGRVKLRVGWAHSWRKNHAKAIAHFNDAKKAFLELQDERGVSEAQYALGRTYVGISEFRIARDHFMAAVAPLSADRDVELLARIYLQLGTTDFHEGAHARSKETYLKAYRLAEGGRSKNLLGQILLNLGLFEEEDPRERERSAEYSRKAINCLAEGGQRNFLALAYNNLGDRLLRSGLWDEAIDNFNRAVEIARQYQQRSDEATARVSLGEILCAKGRYVQAEDQIKASLALVGGGSDKWLEAYGLQILSSIHRDTSRYDGALNALRQSLRISTAIGDMNLVTSAQIALAECHFLQGGYEQAKEYLELTEGRLREERAKSLHVSGWLQRLSGLLEGALGRLAAARQHVAQSISIFTTTEVPYELAKSHLAMAQILATSGEENAAVKHVEMALDTFERLGADPEIKLSKEVIPALRSATATAITLPCFRVPLDYRTPVLVQPEELLSESDVTGRTPPVKSAPETASASSASNDVLLMERLIEASHSRELLLQELAAVIHENFPTEFVVVGKIEDEGKPQPVVCQGITAADAEALSEELGTSLREPSKHPGPGFIALLSVAREGLERNVFAVFVYSMPRSGATLDAGRLNPLIKQAELGLEACQLRAAATSVPETRDEHRIHTVMPGFIVASPLMLDVVHKIQKIRTSDVTVLITGESGTGKELVARAVHAESARARAIFLPFNCTATPRDLIESQLFGHRRGAFTGATTNYVGMIRAAEGGTLFLDEIGDLALEIQPKLMRFLQEGEIQPLGETRPVRVDVRVIAATNTDLERAVEEGRFREDLFHRLNIIRIHVPPLRDRREEIPTLSSFFLAHFASRSGKQGVALTQDAVESLAAYDWPGNIRQLRNEIERVMAYSSEGSKISSEDLSPEVVNPTHGLRSRPMQHVTEFQPRKTERTIDEPRRPPIYSYSSGKANGHGAGSVMKFKEAIADLEARLISEALARNNNNLSRTAIELGLSRRGLRLKLAQLGIERANLQ